VRIEGEQGVGPAQAIWTPPSLPVRLTSHRNLMYIDALEPGPVPLTLTTPADMARALRGRVERSVSGADLSSLASELDRWPA